MGHGWCCHLTTHEAPSLVLASLHSYTPTPKLVVLSQQFWYLLHFTHIHQLQNWSFYLNSFGTCFISLIYTNSKTGRFISTVLVLASFHSYTPTPKLVVLFQQFWYLLHFTHIHQLQNWSFYLNNFGTCFISLIYTNSKTSRFIST